LYFSPKGGATAAVVDALGNAKQSIHVQAYSFTSPAIAKALVAAKRRGLEVKIILDKSQRSERYTEADFTAHAGIPTWIDESHAIAHNKIMILDDDTVITGSFNFTRAAEENNAENLLVLHKTQELAQRYLRNWEAHRQHSKPYSGR
jgi:phosphatidylserine/phosphatidylglycerophosphate/cardiolipin synthase-like enzyme